MNHGLVSLAPGDGHFEEDDDEDLEGGDEDFDKHVDDDDDEPDYGVRCDDCVLMTLRKLLSER